MAAPTVATESDDSAPEIANDVPEGESLDAAEEVAAEEQADESAAPQPDEEEPDVAEADLSEDDLGDSSSDLFTGTEEASGDVSGGDSEESDSDDSGGDALDELGERGESMEGAINDGAARLAVVGLKDEDEKEDLHDEFTEVFEAFQLGYFGSRFMEEYVFAADDGEISPTWGLLGAAACCTALAIWMRPDGDEMVGRAREAVENIAGGALK